MNKIKKYIYPPIFSVGFIAFWVTIGTIINAIPSDDGYGGLGVAVLILLAWIFVVIPIYCIIYSKIIINEKFKFIFSAYNSLLIIVAHFFPFNLQGETTIVILFILMVLFWNIVPLCIKFDSTKKQDENNSSEITNLLNKKSDEFEDE